MNFERTKPFLAPLVLFGVSFWAYLSRLLPGAGFWDTGVFQAVPWTLSFTHPTGYPLYILLGKLFCLVFPFGSIAWRMNLLSALCGASAVMLLFLLCREFVEEDFSLGAALALAFAQIFWRTAVRADPHTLHACFVALLLLLAVRWHKNPSPKKLNLLALVGGLALGNHLMTSMLLPGLFLFVLLHRPKISKLLAPLGAGLLGASVYLYLPLRSWMGVDIPADYPLHSWGNFWHYVLGQDFKGAMGFFSLRGPQTAWQNLPRFAESLSNSLTPFGFWLVVALAFLGIFHLVRKDRSLGVLFFCSLLVPLYAALTYVNGDLERYYFNPLEVLLLLAALGVSALFANYDRIKDYFGGLESRLARLEGKHPTSSKWPDLRQWTFLFVLPPLLLIPHHQKRIWTPSAENFAAQFFQAAKPSSLVMSWWNYSTPLWYFHFVEGKRPDLEIVNGIDRIPVELGKRFDGHRPIYLIQPEDQIQRLSRTYRLERVRGIPDAVYEVKGRIHPAPTGHSREGGNPFSRGLPLPRE